MSRETAIDRGVGNKLVLHSHKENPDAKDSALICMKTEFIIIILIIEFTNCFVCTFLNNKKSDFEKTLVNVLNKIFVSSDTA